MTDTLTQKERRLPALVARHQVSLYFVGTFAISWIGALAVEAAAPGFVVPWMLLR